MAITPAHPRTRSRLAATAGAALFAAAAFSIALLGTGATYALWNVEGSVDGATVRSGTAGLVVDGLAATTVTTLSSPALLPGTSVTTDAPVVVTNTGSVPLALKVATTADGSSPLTGHLAVTAVPTQECSTSIGASSRLGDPAVPFGGAPLGPGESRPLCVVATLDPGAPASVQGAALTVTLVVDGTQVRR